MPIKHQATSQCLTKTPLKYSEFAADYCREFGLRVEGLNELEEHVDEFLRNKRSGQVDSDTVQRIKALIRRSEAREGARCCGVDDKQPALSGLALLPDRTRKEASSW